MRVGDEEMSWQESEGKEKVWQTDSIGKYKQGKRSVWNGVKGERERK